MRRHRSCRCRVFVSVLVFVSVSVTLMTLPLGRPRRWRVSGRRAGGPDRRGAGGTSSVMCVAPMATVLMPIPARDFDPTEVAVTWQVLTGAGHRVVFATPSGQPGAADELMVTGRGLDPWGLIPGLRNLTVVGRVLRADAAARAAYAALVSDEAFGRPLPWGTARRSEYDAARCCPEGTGPGGCATTSRASRSSRWRSMPSPTTSPSAPSATGCSWPPGPSIRGRSAPSCTAAPRRP